MPNGEGLLVRNLRLDEAQVLFDFVSRQHGAGHTGHYSVSELEYYRSIIESQGFALGVFAGVSLVGYALVEFSDLGKDNFGYVVNLPKSELRKVALLSGCLIDPAYRRQGLQSLLIQLRMKEASEYGCTHFFATVHSDNTISANNLIKLGFIVVKEGLALEWGTRNLLHSRLFEV